MDTGALKQLLAQMGGGAPGGQGAGANLQGPQAGGGMAQQPGVGPTMMEKIKKMMTMDFTPSEQEQYAKQLQLEAYKEQEADMNREIDAGFLQRIQESMAQSREQQMQTDMVRNEKFEEMKQQKVEQAQAEAQKKAQQQQLQGLGQGRDMKMNDAITAQGG